MRRKNLFFAMTTSYANKADGQVNQRESPAPGKITIMNQDSDLRESALSPPRNWQNQHGRIRSSIG
jgi:hypothetical protein